jgi:hypothetical protein
MRKVNVDFHNRKGYGCCQYDFEFEDFSELDQLINGFMDSDQFPFYKVCIEITPDGWEPTKEEQAILNKIEMGESVQ